MIGIYCVLWREMRKFWYDKVRVLVVLLQPALWLVFMGNTMNRATAKIPQVAYFLQGAKDYMSYMAPGIIVLGSLFSAVYCGVGLLHDRESGFFDKLLSSPVPRWAVPFGKMLAAAVQNLIQTLILVATSIPFGVPFVTGIKGLLVILLVATLINLGVSAITLVLALSVPTLESYLAVICCLALPLIFASTIMFPTAFMPDWLATASGWNPLSYAVAPIRRLVNVGWIWHELYSGIYVSTAFAAIAFAVVGLSYRKP